MNTPRIPPALLAFLVDSAQKYHPHGTIRVVLFGSRARGDNRQLSDYDIAVDADMTDAAWVRFATDIADGAPTLCGIDLVRFTAAKDGLKQRICEDGVVVHERKQA